MNATQGDEITLRELAVGLVRLLRQHALLWLICSAAGIIIASGVWTTRPQEFESRMSVVSELLPRTFGDRFVIEMQALIADRNWSTLADKLGLQKEEAEGIRSFRVETLNKEETRPIDEGISETVEVSTFVFTVRVLDNKILPRLQEGILEALRTNELARTRLNYRAERNRQIIERIDVELRNLETLKSRMLSDMRGELKIDAELITVSVELLEKKLRYQRDQGVAAALFESFVPYQHPAGPSLPRWMGAGWLIGLIVAGAILLFRKLLEESKA